MVARQEVDWHWHILECLAGACYGSTVHLIRLKGIAADNNELALLLLGNLTESPNGIEPSLVILLLDAI